MACRLHSFTLWKNGACYCSACGLGRRLVTRGNPMAWSMALDEALIQMREHLLSFEDVGRRLGVNPDTARARARLLGLDTSARSYAKSRDHAA